MEQKSREEDARQAWGGAGRGGLAAPGPHSRSRETHPPPPGWKQWGFPSGSGRSPLAYVTREGWNKIRTERRTLPAAPPPPHPAECAGPAAPRPLPAGQGGPNVRSQACGGWGGGAWAVSRAPGLSLQMFPPPLTSCSGPRGGPGGLHPWVLTRAGFLWALAHGDAKGRLEGEKGLRSAA